MFAPLTFNFYNLVRKGNMQITVVTRSVSFYLVALLLPLFAFLTSCSENEGGVRLSLGKHTSDY